MLVPEIGYITDATTSEIIGYRDPVTGNFTPDPAYPLIAIKEDVVCSDSPLLTGKKISQVLWAGGEPMTGENLL